MKLPLVAAFGTPLPPDSPRAVTRAGPPLDTDVTPPLEPLALLPDVPPGPPAPPAPTTMVRVPLEEEV
jgi:hypothetical protein